MNSRRANGTSIRVQEGVPQRNLGTIDELFLEDDWIGGTLVFGDSDASPAVHITMPDERCVMINLDPDTSANDARLMKTVVQLNQNNAGVYATVIRQGIVNVGDRVRLVANTNSPDRDNGT